MSLSLGHKLIKPKGTKDIGIIVPADTSQKTNPELKDMTVADRVLSSINIVPVVPGQKTDPMDVDYINGAEGMIRWIEDNVNVSLTLPGEFIEKWIPMRDLPVIPDPKTGKCFSDIWENQKNILRHALAMDDNGEFIHRLIVFCWMRGEGKSFLACLIQLWKFFCFKRQKIMLGANSKDQVKFVHYDIMREIIKNSPRLMRFIGERNIQEKEIRLINKKMNSVDSLVRSISSFSGIVSNITGYTFSEMFDMKNPKFFVQLDGSIRNMTNAFGVIDSTVSDKTHVLYSLYENARLKKTRTVFFNWRSSKGADPNDYWNPKMDADQLNDYRVKFPFGEFERYFENTWEAGNVRIFTQPIIDEMGYMSADGQILNHHGASELLKKKQEIIEIAEHLQEKQLNDAATVQLNKISALLDRFEHVDAYVPIDGTYNSPQVSSLAQLNVLGDTLDTEWVILAGADIGDPLAIAGQARTIFTAVAKGLPGSRSNPLVSLSDAAPKYIYVMICIADIADHSLDTMKLLAEEIDDEFQGIDKMCTERYGSWDMVQWCEERDIPHESAFPNYERQKDAFKEFFTACREGRFKVGTVGIVGSKNNDLFREELNAFDHDTVKKKFGSPEKFKKGGIQDDSVYSTAWCVFGGRTLGVDDFRTRSGRLDFGSFSNNEDHHANYS